MYNRNKLKLLFTPLFCFLDVICLVLALICSYYFVYNSVNFFVSDIFRFLLSFLLLIDAACSSINKTFESVMLRNLKKEAWCSFAHLLCFFIMAFPLFLLFYEKYEMIQVVFIEFYFCYFFFSISVRILAKRVLSGCDIIKSSILIVLNEKYSYEEFFSDNLLIADSYSKIGFCVLEGKHTGEKLYDYPVVAGKEEILDYVTRNWVDEVLLESYSIIDNHKDIIDSLIEAGLTIRVPVRAIDSGSTTSQFIEEQNGQFYINSSISSVSAVESAGKRIFDIVVSVFGCLITIVLTAVIGPIIFANDPGPIFYSSVRIGKNGRRFKMYKFRSMVKNADELKPLLEAQNQIKDGMMFKVENDPRIIGGRGGIGEFIRKTSIDEFPQFFNVLLGQMSIVGTRPPTPDEWEKYKLHHRARMSAVPGITGKWQVSGRSDITDFEKVVELDTSYIKNWSLLEDLKIFAKTISAVLARKGAM